MDDIEAYIGDDEHKEWKVEFDKLFGEKIPSKTNATKSVRKVKFAVIRKWFVVVQRISLRNRCRF